MQYRLRSGIERLKLVGATVSILLLVAVPAVPVRAATVTSPQPAPRISFTFDDGLASTVTMAQPTLAKYGLSATDYVITGCVGMTQVPNTCRANTSYSYMTWSQIQALQNTDGWEIGSHTVDHKCLASNASIDPGDCQTNTLTLAQVDAELANSKSTLAANGITATDFAPPYGDYNNSVLQEIAKYYASMRNFRNDSSNANVWPYSDYYLWDYVIQEGVTPVSAVESAINTAIANNQWLILTFHEIRTNPSSNPDDYQYGNAELDQIAAYVQSKEAAGLQPVHINQGLVTSSTNLLPNSSFNSGIASGWHTDSPTGVTADSGTNGSFPDATNSVKLVSGSASEHLFSPVESVSPSTTYLFKTFLNVQAITSGEVGFYIDEYDANGNWISGQWKTAENSAFVEDMNFTYKPSSANVSKAALQIYLTGNPGITTYVDNAQWFPLSSTQSTNLMPNNCFASGIAGGWHTDDSTNIKADSANNGDATCNPTSVYLQSGSTSSNGHLFSPLVSVSPSTTYTIASWLNIKQITNTSSGEVGFYIDEYDANGNWISGQYKFGAKTLGPSMIDLSYKPSSANVNRAALQVIVIGNAGVQAYYDDVLWAASS